MDDYKIVENCVNILSKIGEKYFICPISSDGQKIGMALTDSNLSANEIFNLAYAYFEDKNFHDICAVLDWINSPDITDEQLERLENIIGHNGIIKQYDVEGNFVERKVKITLNVEWLDKDN